MDMRLSLRRYALFLGALAWAGLPTTLYAGPGGHGGGGGSHGGSGGGHGGASHSSRGGGGYSGGSGARSGGHSSYAYSSPGARVSVPAGGYYGRAAALYSGGSSAGSDGSRFNSLSNFVPTTEATPAQIEAQNHALSNLASHGWHFLPSAGVTRPVTAARGPFRAIHPVRPGAIPAILPFHRPRPVHPYAPYATDVITPFYGWGYGFGYGYGLGGCFFNGFTSVCGTGPYNPYWYGFGANSCLSAFYNCGYGYGGYGYGLNYLSPYDTDSGWDTASGLPADADNIPPDADNNVPADDADNSNIYLGPTDNGPASSDSASAQPARRVPRAQILLKGGSGYEVTAYWVSGGQLYFRPVTGGLSHVPLEQLDLTATVQANSRNGVSFTLTDHPPRD